MKAKEFGFALAVFALSVLPAAAADDSGLQVTVTLTPVEMSAIEHAFDRQPIDETPPAGFWDAKTKLLHALEANPAALRAAARASRTATPTACGASQK